MAAPCSSVSAMRSVGSGTSPPSPKQHTVVNKLRPGLLAWGDKGPSQELAIIVVVLPHQAAPVRRKHDRLPLCKGRLEDLNHPVNPGAVVCLEQHPDHNFNLLAPRQIAILDKLNLSGSAVASAICYLFTNAARLAGHAVDIFVALRRGLPLAPRLGRKSLDDEKGVFGHLLKEFAQHKADELQQVRRTFTSEQRRLVIQDAAEEVKT